MTVLNTKEKIKETALRLFLEKGYQVGINEIIKTSGSSKGAFYHHFGSKQQLFVNTIDEFFFIDNGEIEMVINSENANFVEKIMLLIKFAFEPFLKIKALTTNKKKINYLCIIAEYPNHEDLQRKSLARSEKLQKGILKILNRAKNNQELLSGIDIYLLSMHLGMLFDGAIFDAILTFDSVEESEKVCLAAVKQMLGLVKV